MKTILVTGTSSGIGSDIVRALDHHGYRVLATVRSQTDANKLKAKFSTNVIPMVIDLSDLKQIAELERRIKEDHQIHRLDGLINNAGMALAGPFLEQDFTEIENTIRLNVLSVMKLTQVLLPMLGATKDSTHVGRIINVSSISGRGGAPFLSAYAASKHAIEGFSDALRKELMIFGIKVVVIGPGSIKTPIWSKGFGEIKDRYKNSIYADSFQKFLRVALDEEKNALSVSKISDLVVKIFASQSPAFRYAPIPRVWMNSILPSLLPKRFYNFLTARALGLIKK